MLQVENTLKLKQYFAGMDAKPFPVGYSNLKVEQIKSLNNDIFDILNDIDRIYNVDWYNAITYNVKSKNSETINFGALVFGELSIKRNRFITFFRKYTVQSDSFEDLIYFDNSKYIKSNLLGGNKTSLTTTERTMAQDWLKKCNSINSGKIIGKSKNCNIKWI